jgi:hypothetical protein
MFAKERATVLLCIALVLTAVSAAAQRSDLKFLNKNQPVLDAHNCYPYDGRWNDRIDRALNSGFPVSIEQDLAWYVDPATGKGRVVVSHTPSPTGHEPTLRSYFFERVQPIVEEALAENKQSEWPLIILHFDFKDTQPAILHAVWSLLGEYEPWLSTAVKTTDPQELSVITRRPILVITEDSDAQQKVFFDDLPIGARLRLFGSAHTSPAPKGLSPEEAMHWAVTVPPAELLSDAPTNYRRWWNLPWNFVEEGGQTKAGDWTPGDDARLRALVTQAHQLGYWIRLWTLDGFKPADDQGWGTSYNFGSKPAVILRWKAAIAADVNFIATDQQEDLAPYLKQDAQNLRPDQNRAPLRPVLSVPCSLFPVPCSLFPAPLLPASPLPASTESTSANCSSKSRSAPAQVALPLLSWSESALRPRRANPPKQRERGRASLVRPAPAKSRARGRACSSTGSRWCPSRPSPVEKSAGWHRDRLKAHGAADRGASK